MKSSIYITSVIIAIIGTISKCSFENTKTGNRHLSNLNNEVILNAFLPDTVTLGEDIILSLQVINISTHPIVLFRDAAIYMTIESDSIGFGESILFLNGFDYEGKKTFKDSIVLKQNESYTYDLPLIIEHSFFRQGIMNNLLGNYILDGTKLRRNF